MLLNEVFTLNVLIIWKKCWISWTKLLFSNKRSLLRKMYYLFYYIRLYRRKFKFHFNWKIPICKKISARIQPFCRKHNINIGCFDGTRLNPRNVTPWNTSLFIYNNRFCLIWKSNGNSFNQVIEDELEPNFKVVDNVISDKHVKSFIEY